MKTLIIIPTYNEEQNIEKLVYEVLKQDIPFLDILIVDGNSSDKTIELAEKLSQKTCQVKLIIQKEKNGLGSAYLAGFNYALKNNYAYIIEMDADFSHDPKYLPIMHKLARKNDFVIGSRYVLGGGTKNWSFARKLLSKSGSIYARKILKLPIFDLTGGFNLWNRKVLESIGLDNIKSQGYCFQIELKYKAFKKGFSFVEFPIVFADREKGKSKMNWKIAFEAIWKVPTLRNSNSKTQTSKEAQNPKHGL